MAIVIGMTFIVGLTVAVIRTDEAVKKELGE